MIVLVIGCGPAGLAAAHAAVGMDRDVRIWAPKEKTPQRGPLLVQRPIPGINVDHPDGYIKQIVVGGSILDYRYKLYGDINININGDILADGYHAWRMKETYDALWDRYSWAIEDRKITSQELHRLGEMRAFELIVSTAPAPSLCLQPKLHTFRYAPVAVTPFASFQSQPDNTIIFNADPEVPWVRSSCIFGNEVTEWPIKKAPHVTARIIRKPISTTCNCNPHVLRTGRFGAWKNETWVDTAFYDVRTALVTADNEHIWNGVKA